MGGGEPYSTTEQDKDKASTGFIRDPPLLLMWCGPDSSHNIEHDSITTSHSNRHNGGDMPPATGLCDNTPKRNHLLHGK
eukprot:12325885-Ditylum_brightwellii.AAC.1